MSARYLRSSLAAFLIIATALSLLPVYAGNQASDSTKRGKNGASSKQSLPKETQANKDSDTYRQEDDYSISRPPQKNFAPQSGAQPSQPAPQKKRREPPPFDRPPITASPKDETKDETPPRSQDRRAEPAPPPNRDADAEDRSGKRPPVLRRPSDSRYPAPQDSEKREPQRSDPDADEPIKLDATLVNIPLVVSDRSGRYIPQLDKDDFILYEDGTKQEVAFFGDERVPFNVALLLDVSPSVQGYLEDIQDAAIEFVRQLRANDRVMVVSFDRSVHFLTDLTSDRRELEYAIRRTTTGGGTSVYDAVYETVAQRMRRIEGRKALILFSDGEDTTSRQATYDDCIEIVTEADVLVYGLRYPGSGMPTTNRWPRNPIPQIPIPLPWPWPRRRRGSFTNAAPAQQRWPGGRGGDFMADITEAGGGPVFDAVTVSDIGRLAARIAEELRHVYVISYYPTNPLSAGGYRSIRVRVRGRDDIAIRHRKGYNAQDVKNRT